MKIIRIVGLVDGRTTGAEGGYIVRCDVEARGGRGALEVTQDPARALHFPDATWALRFVRRQSKTRPLRPDGQPNRPLTAYTVEIMDAPRARLDA